MRDYQEGRFCISVRRYRPQRRVLAPVSGHPRATEEIMLRNRCQNICTWRDPFASWCAAEAARPVQRTAVPSLANVRWQLAGQKAVPLRKSHELHMLAHIGAGADVRRT